MKIFILYIILISIGCSGRSSQKEIEISTKTAGSLAKDSSWTTRLSIALNLPRINRGVDSFELRLWSSLSMTDLQILKTLRFSAGQWYCSESRYWVGKLDEWGKNRSLWADSVQTKNITLSVRYKDLIDSIKSYKIWNMPSQHNIPGFVDRTADGMTYTLEIAENNKYHCITYRNPQAYTDSANKNFYSLLNYLTKSINAFSM